MAVDRCHAEKESDGQPLQWKIRIGKNTYRVNTSVFNKSRAPTGIMASDAFAPWGRETSPKMPEFAVPRGGMTKGVEKVWSNVAKAVPLSPAELTTRSMLNSKGSGFLTVRSGFYQLVDSDIRSRLTIEINSWTAVSREGLKSLWTHWTWLSSNDSSCGKVIVRPCFQPKNTRSRKSAYSEGNVNVLNDADPKQVNDCTNRQTVDRFRGNGGGGSEEELQRHKWRKEGSKAHCWIMQGSQLRIWDFLKSTQCLEECVL